MGEGGEIKNLGVAKGSYISATGSSGYAGGIAGQASGAIIGCYNTGEVSASASNGSYAGGIAGWAENGTTITGCYNTGEVSASVSYAPESYAGGIAGWAYGTITGCYNTGEVTASASFGSSNAGGVAGYVDGGAIIGCYNTGKVSAAEGGNGSAGGIAGWAENGTTITGCYNTGAVSASETAGGGSNAGGIAGNASGTVTGCYNTGEVSASVSYAPESYAGGIAGGAYGTITGCYYLNADGMVRGVGNNDDREGQCEKKSLNDMQTAAFADKLNAAVEALKNKVPEEAKTALGLSTVLATLDEAKQKLEEKLKTETDWNRKNALQNLMAKIKGLQALPEDGKVFKYAPGRTPELWWKVALDRKKAQALAVVDSIKAEVAKLSQLYEVSVDEKLKSLDGIKVKIIPTATVEQVEEQLQAARGVLTGFRTKLQIKDCNLGHTRSSIGGQAGFYKAPDGVVTFKVVPNPGYKISRIVTSGSEYLKPGSVVKALPEWVTVRFEKV